MLDFDRWNRQPEVEAPSGAERVPDFPYLMNRVRKVLAVHHSFERSCAESADISGALVLA